jgi:hypothetical protein
MELRQMDIVGGVLSVEVLARLKNLGHETP